MIAASFRIHRIGHLLLLQVQAIHSSTLDYTHSAFIVSHCFFIFSFLDWLLDRSVRGIATSQQAPQLRSGTAHLPRNKSIASIQPLWSSTPRNTRQECFKMCVTAADCRLHKHRTLNPSRQHRDTRDPSRANQLANERLSSKYLRGGDTRGHRHTQL